MHKFYTQYFQSSLRGQSSLCVKIGSTTVIRLLLGGGIGHWHLLEPVAVELLVAGWLEGAAKGGLVTAQWVLVI